MDELQYDIPVLLLHNINPEWTSEEKQETGQDVATLGNTLSELGHSIEVVAVEDDCLVERLSVFNPRDYVVFNWCEELPGVPHSEPLIAAVMEKRAFVFTGSSYDVLALAHDKPAVKRILNEAKIPTPLWNVFDNTGAEDWNIFPSIVNPSSAESHWM